VAEAVVWPVAVDVVVVVVVVVVEAVWVVACKGPTSLRQRAISNIAALKNKKGRSMPLLFL